MTTTQILDHGELARHIAEMYRDVANESVGDLHFHTGRGLAERLGYPPDLLGQLPDTAVSSFAGVGFHLGLARLHPGERVLDLGSGSGMDVFAAALRVGPAGSVVGLDITPGPGGRLALADIVTQRTIAARTAAQPDLWAACIAGAGQRDRYLHDIAVAGLQLRTVRRNRAYSFASERTQRTTDKYDAHTIELLAVKPTEELSK